MMAKDSPSKVDHRLRAAWSRQVQRAKDFGLEVLADRAFVNPLERRRRREEQAKAMKAQQRSFGRRRDSREVTALVSATKRGNVRAVRLLLKRGDMMSIDEPQGDGSSAMSTAVREGRLEIIKVLLDFGADVNKVVDGQTPIQRAVRNGHPQIVRYLLKKGCVCDPRKLLDIAAEAGHTKVCNVILNHRSLAEENRRGGYRRRNDFSSGDRLNILMRAARTKRRAVTARPRLRTVSTSSRGDKHDGVVQRVVEERIHVDVNDATRIGPEETAAEPQVEDTSTSLQIDVPQCRAPDESIPTRRNTPVSLARAVFFEFHKKWNAQSWRQTRRDTSTMPITERMHAAFLKSCAGQRVQKKALVRNASLAAIVLRDVEIWRRPTGELVRSVECSGSSPTKSEIRGFCDALNVAVEAQKQPTRLYLSACHLKSRDASLVVQTLDPKQTHVLDVSHNNIGAQTAHELSRLLCSRSCALSILDLSRVSRGLGGGDNLCTLLKSGLQHCVSLRRLRLTDNGITDVGVRTLCDALRALSARRGAIAGSSKRARKQSVFGKSTAQMRVERKKRLSTLRRKKRARRRRKATNVSGVLPITAAKGAAEAALAAATFANKTAREARELLWDGLIELDVSNNEIRNGASVILRQITSLLLLNVSNNPIGGSRERATTSFVELCHAIATSELRLCHLIMCDVNMSDVESALLAAALTYNHTIVECCVVHDNDDKRARRPGECVSSDGLGFLTQHEIPSDLVDAQTSIRGAERSELLRRSGCTVPWASFPPPLLRVLPGSESIAATRGWWIQGRWRRHVLSLNDVVDLTGQTAYPTMLHLEVNQYRPVPLPCFPCADLPDGLHVEHESYDCRLGVSLMVPPGRVRYFFSDNEGRVLVNRHVKRISVDQRTRSTSSFLRSHSVIDLAMNELTSNMRPIYDGWEPLPSARLIRPVRAGAAPEMDWTHLRHDVAKDAKTLIKSERERWEKGANSLHRGLVKLSARSNKAVQTASRVAIDAAQHAIDVAAFASDVSVGKTAKSGARQRRWFGIGREPTTRRRRDPIKRTSVIPIRDVESSTSQRTSIVVGRRGSSMFPGGRDKDDRCKLPSCTQRFVHESKQRIGRLRTRSMMRKRPVTAPCDVRRSDTTMTSYAEDRTLLLWDIPSRDAFSEETKRVVKDVMERSAGHVDDDSKEEDVGMSMMEYLYGGGERAIKTTSKKKKKKKVSTKKLRKKAVKMRRRKVVRAKKTRNGRETVRVVQNGMIVK